MSDPKPFTVIGYHRDNHQPWVEHVEAADAAQAVPIAAAKMAHNNDGVAELEVVEVFEGHHKGQLGADETLSFDFVEDDEFEEDSGFELDDSGDDDDSVHSGT